MASLKGDIASEVDKTFKKLRLSKLSIRSSPAYGATSYRLQVEAGRKSTTRCSTRRRSLASPGGLRVPSDGVQFSGMRRDVGCEVDDAVDTAVPERLTAYQDSHSCEIA